MSENTTETFQFYNATPEALKQIANIRDPRWKALPPGMMFVVAYHETRTPADPGKAMRNLQSKASNVGKALKRKFRVVHHPDKSCFEVARLLDEDRG